MLQNAAKLMIFLYFGMFFGGAEFHQMFNIPVAVLSYFVCVFISVFYTGSYLINGFFIRIAAIVFAVFVGWIFAKSAPFVISDMTETLVTENVPISFEYKMDGRGNKTGAVIITNIGDKRIKDAGVICSYVRENGQVLNHTFRGQTGQFMFPGQTAIAQPFSKIQLQGKVIDGNVNAVVCKPEYAVVVDTPEINTTINNWWNEEKQLTYFTIENKEAYEIGHMQVKCMDSKGINRLANYQPRDNNTIEEAHTIPANSTRDYVVQVKFLKLTNCKVTNAIKMVK